MNPLITLARVWHNWVSPQMWGPVLGGSVASSSFSPTDISGLLLWLKADQITGLANGDPVATWVNQSGSASNATSPGGSQPIYTTNVQNGLPGVHFDGTSQLISGTVTISGTTCSVFVVATLESGSNSYGRILSIGTNGTNDYDNTASAEALSRDGTNQGLSSYRASAPKSVKSISAYSTAFTAASIFNGTNNIVTVDGTAGTTVSTTGSFSVSKYTLGNVVGGTASRYKGYIFEICVYSTALNSTDLANLKS